MVPRLARPLIHDGGAAAVARGADAGAVRVDVVRVVAGARRRRPVLVVVHLAHGDVLLVVVVLPRGLGSEAHLGFADCCCC